MDALLAVTSLTIGVQSNTSVRTSIRDRTYLLQANITETSSREKRCRKHRKYEIYVQ